MAQSGNGVDDRARLARRHRNERIIAAIVVLIVAAAAAAVILFNRRTAKELRKDTSYIPKPTRFTPEVDLLRQYIRIDTSNPPGKERAGADFLAGLLRANGVQSEIIESAPGRANLYARIKGKRSGDGLLLLNHIDVVPANPKGWTRPPFAADIYLNELYGRGALDMKSTAICELRAFLDVAKSGRQPERDIVFLAVADEEVGHGDLGTAWLLAHRPDVFSGIGYALNEGGITEMSQDRMLYFGIEIGTKITVSLILEAPTREQLQRTREALEPWFFAREPDRILPEVRRFFRDLAPSRTDFKKQLADVDRAVADGEFWQLPLGYRELTQNGVWAEGVLPKNGRWQMRVLLLNLPDENPDKRIQWLRRQIEPFGARVAEIQHKEPPAPLTSDETPLFALLKREAERSYHAPVGIEILNRAENDSRHLRRQEIAAYGISPFPADFFETDSIHGVDERIRVDHFIDGVELMRRVVWAWAYE